MMRRGMLHTLHILNLALVDELEAEFEPGLNIITGETGAGKSLIIGALNLLLGERADKALLRSGAEHGFVEAAFRLALPDELQTLLQESGIEPDEDGRLIVKRVLSASGAGRQFVNNTAVTLQTLKRIGEFLVDMHGPHEHQGILSPDFQLRILDAYGRLGGDRAVYEEVFRQRAALLAQRRELLADENEPGRQVDLLTFQVRELEDASLSAEEETEILREQKELGSAQSVLQAAETVRQALTEAEESAFQRLAEVQKILSQLAGLSETAVAWKNEAQALAAQIQDLSLSVNAFVQKIEGDPGRLQWLEERLAVYQKLKRKYGGTVADLAGMLTKARERLRNLLARDERLREMDAALQGMERNLAERGAHVSRQRQAAAALFVKAVSAELKGLGFERSAFDVEFKLVDPRLSGIDALEFSFAPNPGEPARPLRAIASSGEISRVMLALKTVLAEHDCVPVLVFDEIDVNLGGRIAHRVGAKMAQVARRRQVLCITHLPQVAAHGGCQFLVNKTVAAGRAVSTMIKLDNAGRIDEISRMLGGSDAEGVTGAHARALLAGASGAEIVKKTGKPRIKKGKSGS